MLTAVLTYLAALQDSLGPGTSAARGWGHVEALPLPLFSVISWQRGTLLTCHIRKYFPCHVGRLVLVRRTILDLCANFDFHYYYLDIIFMQSHLLLLMYSLNKKKHELYLLLSLSVLEGLVYGQYRDNED